MIGIVIGIGIGILGMGGMYAFQVQLEDGMGCVVIL